jgi:PAS domain S-box-containing protein
MTTGFLRSADDPFHVALCDADETFLAVNESYAARFGLRPAQIIGRRVLDVVGRDAYLEVAPFIRRVLEGEELEFTRDLQYDSVGTRTMRATYVPQFGPDGRVACFIAVLQDASAGADAERMRQEALAHARAAQQMAEAANRMKDEFLATISHELRTPINAVLGWTRMLSQPGISEEMRARGIETIERNALATATIIEDLLDVSRIVTGDFRIGRSDVNLDDLVRRAIETVSPAAHLKHQTLTIAALDPAAHVVVGDAIRLQQVVWNVLTNAIRYTPDGGRIVISLYARDEQVHLQVTDSGQGISSDVLPFIFERFRQGDASSTRRHGGLGLGLAIARELVSLHGGTISAHSEGVGKGAVFVVALPRKPDVMPEQLKLRAEAAQVVLEQSEVNVAGMSVLIVEPDEESRRFMATTLRQRDVDVTTAVSASEARSVCADRSFDVLLCATTLPDGDGYALLRDLRRDGRILPPSTAAVAVTSHHRVEDRTRGHAAGFQLHLRTPVDPSELVAAVSALRR